ncbi:MAG: hypothetical protein ACD_78C00467G0005 [uncultured bacterium (gcode 4)]|uniref:Uncharacterized protein n=1 Tax=uncultured bacterium (gcode 4) TaxID=1234023 RepID=K1Y9Z4_9BACT|nr:MAG: hypothetical protein ACD_78C00467G0005 [uncultured bacterium (gcode 4)]
MTIGSDTIEKEQEGPNKEDRILGALCYAPFGCFAPLMMQKESPFLSFHVKQGGIIFWVYFILNIVPIPGFFGLLTLTYIGLAGFAGWKAYDGEMYSYEFIDVLLEKFKK